MSEQGGEINSTRFAEIKKNGRGYSTAFLVSPPLSEKERDAIRPGVREPHNFSEADLEKMKNLDDLEVMRKVSILAGEVEIDGVKGTILVFNRKKHNESIITDVTLIADAIATMRQQESFELALNTQQDPRYTRP